MQTLSLVVRTGRALRAPLVACALIVHSLAVAPHAAAGEAVAADAVIRTTSAELLALVKEARGYYATDPEQLHSRLSEILPRFVDLPAIAGSVMSQFGKTATPEQKARFVVAFKRGLVRTYAKAMMEFDVDRVEFGKTTPEGKPGQAKVSLQIIGTDGKAYPVEYSMRQAADGSWLVRNMTIAALNFGLTYRNQFAAAMAAPENGKSIDKVIDGWSPVDAPAGTPAAAAAATPATAP